MLVLIFWASCKKEEAAVAVPEPGNEYLTTVMLLATNAADSSDMVSAKWVSIPGAAIDTSHITLNLKKNASYKVSVKFLDESKSPSSDITPEILERANYHLICFNVAPALQMTVAATDHDTNTPALPIGLSNLFTTTGVSSGNLELLLHHQPNVKNGDCSPGSVDADVNFTVVVN